MTPDQLDLIADSARVATADPKAFAGAFYRRLFEIDPTIRSLFSADMTQQGDKLVDELEFLIGAATNLDLFPNHARDLGRRHAGYGVEVAHYEILERALLETLAATCVDFWTDAHREAWHLLYTLIAETMMEGAGRSLFD